MKSATVKKRTPLNKKKVKQKAISSLRSSFAFEGISFTNKEVEEMVKTARARRTRAKK